MKIRVIVSAAIISMCSVSQVSAYIYSFSNHTNDPLKVRVQLNGVNEPWEEVYIPAKEMRDFPWTALGHSRPSLNIWKAGFCLQNIQVAIPLKRKMKAMTSDGIELDNLEESIKDAQGQIQFGPWASVTVKFVKSEGAQAILNAADKFADSLGSLAKEAAGAYAEYKTK